MNPIPTSTVDVFSEREYGLWEPDPVRQQLRASGGIVRVPCPWGAELVVIQDAGLARTVFNSRHLRKGAEFAPAEWRGHPEASLLLQADGNSLASSDGETHKQLHGVLSRLFDERRVAGAQVFAGDFCASHLDTHTDVDFSEHFNFVLPGAVFCHLLDLDPEHFEPELIQLPGIAKSDLGEKFKAISALTNVAERAMGDGSPLVLGLQDAGLSPAAVISVLLEVGFAAVVTSEIAVARVAAEVAAPVSKSRSEGVIDTQEAVGVALRSFPPAGFSLFRFAEEDISVGGYEVREGEPVAVDIVTCNEAWTGGGLGFTFGAGPHYCVGAQLAVAMLSGLVDVLLARRSYSGITAVDDLRVHEDVGLRGRRIVGARWLSEPHRE